MNTDKTDLKVIGAVLLALLFCSEVFMVVDRSENAYIPILFLFIIFWIMRLNVMLHMAKPLFFSKRFLIHL